MASHLYATWTNGKSWKKLKLYSLERRREQYQIIYKTLLKAMFLTVILMTKWEASFVVQVREWAEFVISNLSTQNTKTSGRDVFHKKVLVCSTPSPKVYFNRINFREIKFRDFANFCQFREIKTRKNVWDCWLAKLIPQGIFKIAFWVDKPVKTLHLCLKIAIFSCFQAHSRN